ncbi:CDP-glycerol glycerophosphotransferase family protein [Pediococcus pentosaceus]|uniref:CDP-glycerol glycerophosphotransferase family protein n=1 Tax=Pediococcus pentosaceus TaxID=1255 RepID=UPI001F560081|nr:CDP-glycerol glycerophosphotransferase family protein [Pediococcus pentosaceus]MCI2960160.1 CDP-glycerol glycerophosphotransferase family protein [Pediococcus pentosaceus]
MKERIKKNKVMSYIYIYMIKFLFRIIQCFIRVDENKILFVSFAGKQYSDSPKVLYLSLKNDEDFKKFKFMWGFINPENVCGINEKEKVNINSLRYLYELASAKFWVSNASIERLVPIKTKQHIYINTWHGIPLKTLGKDDIKADNLVTNWYENAEIDYLTVNGYYDQEIMRKIFPKTKNIIQGGLPRNYRLYNINYSDRKEIESKLHLNTNKKNILYAPTFRDSEKEMSEILSVLNELDNYGILDNYNFLFRGHYFFDTNRNNITKKVINVSKYESIEELYIVSDMLISDYSSVIFDYSILKRPIILYIPDVDLYKNRRGFYKNPYELDLPVTYNAKQLKNCILESENGSPDKMVNFYNRYHNFEFSSIEKIKRIIYVGR